MEHVEMKRCYIALDYDTCPHRLLIQTRIRPTYSMPETSSLFMILVVAHQSESTRCGLTFSDDFLYVGAEYFRCCWKCRSSQFSQYEASGPATFLFSITNRNVDICKELYANVVWSVAPPCSNEFCARDERTDGVAMNFQVVALSRYGLEDSYRLPSAHSDNSCFFFFATAMTLYHCLLKKKLATS